MKISSIHVLENTKKVTKVDVSILKKLLRCNVLLYFCPIKVSLTTTNGCVNYKLFQKRINNPFRKPFPNVLFQ